MMVPLVFPPENKGALAKLADENIYFHAAALKIVTDFADAAYATEREKGVFIGNFDGILDSGFYKIEAEEVGDAIRVNVQAWSFLDHKYKNFQDFSEIEIGVTEGLIDYYLGVN